MKTKVVRFHEFGGPEVLRFEFLEVGEPAAGEVRVRIEAIGLNRAEAGFRSDRYIERAILPARIGYEAAGIVEALGEGVKGFSVGEQICVLPSFSMNKYGVYAEQAIVPASALLKRPGKLGAHACAAIWMQYLTAYGALIGWGRARLTFEPSGAVRDVVLESTADLSDTAIECLRHELSAVSASRFEGAPITIGASYFVR